MQSLTARSLARDTSHVMIRAMSRPKQYANAAERQAAYRARKGTPVQVFLDAELVAALDEYIARQQMDRDADATRSSVIAKVLRSQLLRKR